MALRSLELDKIRIQKAAKVSRKRTVDGYGIYCLHEEDTHGMKDTYATHSEFGHSISRISYIYGRKKVNLAGFSIDDGRMSFELNKRFQNLTLAS